MTAKVLAGSSLRYPAKILCVNAYPVFQAYREKQLLATWPATIGVALQDSLIANLEHQQSVLPPWTYLEAYKHHSMHYTCIISFAAEGNNMPDAMQLADAANQPLQLLAGLDKKPTKADSDRKSRHSPQMSSLWAPPMSWKYVYGSIGPRHFY